MSKAIKIMILATILWSICMVSFFLFSIHQRKSLELQTKTELELKKQGFKTGYYEGLKYGRKLCVGGPKVLYDTNRIDSLLKLNLYESKH